MFYLWSLEIRGPDLLPRIAPQRDWCNVFLRYFCNSISNQFLAAWKNSRAVLDIIQTPSFYYFWDLYISKVEKQTALKLVLAFESPSKFWGFQITYRLPVRLPLLCKRPITNIVQFHYPGTHPPTKNPEDSGYEIDLKLNRHVGFI